MKTCTPSRPSCHRQNGSRWTPRGVGSRAVPGDHRQRVPAARCRAPRPDRASWSPDITSGGWQWMARAAAMTSHLSELALRSLAVRTGQLMGLDVTDERMDRAADSMIGMREAWQRVDLMCNTIVTERRSLPTPAMSEAGDLLLRRAARLGQPAVDTCPRPPWPPQDPARPSSPAGRVHRRGVGCAPGG